MIVYKENIVHFVKLSHGKIPCTAKFPTAKLPMQRKFQIADSNYHPSNIPDKPINVPYSYILAMQFYPSSILVLAVDKPQSIEISICNKPELQ